LQLTYENREGISKLLGGIGIIIMVMGIFSELFTFNQAIVIAIFFWMLNGVFRDWIKFDDSSHTGYFNHTHAFSRLMSSLGVLIILSSIFLNTLSFSWAIILAITCFIIAGSFGEFSGTSKSKKQRKFHPTSSTTFNPSTQTDLESSNNKAQLSPKTNNIKSQFEYSDEGPAKKSCRHCGYSIKVGDIFCSNCGESN
jgi:hypothetical protein